jgi:hypothetical protein
VAGGHTKRLKSRKRRYRILSPTSYLSPPLVAHRRARSPPAVAERVAGGGMRAPEMYASLMHRHHLVGFFGFYR